jgi:CO dehydrogenase maturation factor
MRVAFVGKGGSGKTTLSALFSRHLACSGAPVVAIDGDINQHLAYALGLDEDELITVPPLSARTGEIKDHLRGINPRIPSPDAMVKTTPPGRGSRLLRLLGDDEIHTQHVQEVNGVPLMVTGASAQRGYSPGPSTRWLRYSSTAPSWEW